MKLFYSDKYLIENHNGEIIYYLFFNLDKHFLEVNSWYKQIKINWMMYENIIYSRKILPDLFKTFIGRCYWMKMFVSMIDVKFSLKTVVFAVVDICCRCLNFIAAVSIHTDLNSYHLQIIVKISWEFFTCLNVLHLILCQNTTL